MNEIDKFTSVIDNLIATDIPFALWKMPDSHSPALLISSGEKIVATKSLSSLDDSQGFLFAPYRTDKETPIFLLRSEVTYYGIEEIIKHSSDNRHSHSTPLSQGAEPPKEDLSLESKETSSHSSAHSHITNPYLISKENYMDEVEKAVSKIKSGQLSKVIISRQILQQRNGESIGALFWELMNRVSNTFIYLINLSSINSDYTTPGVWMGATPELFFKSNGDMMETVSLAGTQPRQDNPDYSWHTKEIEEQAFVSRYLLDLLYRHQVYPYSTQGPETIESGDVAHLITRFRFSKSTLKSQISKFIVDLHPTPATCGYPKEEAIELIEMSEKHNRRYYTGFLGTWNIKETVNLYVNLRCMEIFKDNYLLYAGSGITSRSVSEDEWIETGKKAHTLLSVIEAINK